MKKLSSKNKREIQVSGILFGTKKGKLADFISLTDLVMKYLILKKLKMQKKN